MGLYRQLFFVFYLSIFGCADDATSLQVDDLDAIDQASGQTIDTRFPPPKGYARPSCDSISFANYLRTLPLKEPASSVKYFNGKMKSAPVHVAVVDLEIGNKDLHQCADAIMRLRAEYLWNQEEYEKIHFNFTSGDRIDYSEWMKGRRIHVEGNSVSWENSGRPSNTYDDFWAYMETIFTYAGTASLSKELRKVDVEDAQIGDVFIQGGFPGHAVLIVDMLIHTETGKRLYLLGQSYMPAQDFHILKNGQNKSFSPWYDLAGSSVIVTPEWTFEATDLKRFVD